MIVSEIAGTTIDAISIPFTVDDQEFIFIDTAGIRKGYKNNHKVEYFSYVRAMHSVEECDVVIFICDAQEGIVDQDLKIINMVCEMGKPIVIALNKIDLLTKKEKMTSMKQEGSIKLCSRFYKIRNIRNQRPWLQKII